VDLFLFFTCLYIITAIFSFIPVFIAIIRKVRLKPGGVSFDESPHFTDEAKFLLNSHYSRLNGTLIFWKNQAKKYIRFHYYCLYWTIPISIIIPILTQTVSENFYSKLLLTVISTHSAILLSFHKGFKVDQNIIAFRHGESEFYDLYRNLLDRPHEFGNTENEQINSYFKQVESIRKFIRNAETDNFPIIDYSKMNKN